MNSFHTVTSAMAKWTTSFFLILALVTGALSGMPLHSNENECAHGMSGMDCCKVAQGHGSEQEVATARICCAVNCPQSGTKGSSSIRIPKPSFKVDVTFPSSLQ